MKLCKSQLEKSLKLISMLYFNLSFKILILGLLYDAYRNLTFHKTVLHFLNHYRLQFISFILIILTPMQLNIFNKIANYSKK